MNANRTLQFVALILLVAFASTKLTAEEIYRWVDKNGVPNYSQYPPNGDIAGVSTQELEDVTPPSDGQAGDIYDIEAHQQRMTAWREEREQKRKDVRESKKLAARQQPIKYQPQARSPLVSYWYPPIYGRPPHKPQLPIERPHPPSAVLPKSSLH